APPACCCSAGRPRSCSPSSAACGRSSTTGSSAPSADPLRNTDVEVDARRRVVDDRRRVVAVVVRRAVDHRRGTVGVAVPALALPAIVVMPASVAPPAGGGGRGQADEGREGECYREGDAV